MNRTIFLEDKTIFLRFLNEKDDLSGYETWVNDQETTRYMGIGRFPMTVKLLQDYIQQYNGSKEFLLGIFLKENNFHVGNITLHQIDLQNRMAEIGLFVGHIPSRGKGIGAQAVRLVVTHAFDRLNLNKVTAGMIEGNIASQKLFEGIGFKKEGELREHFYLEGKYLSCLRYGLLKSEYLR